VTLIISWYIAFCTDMPLPSVLELKL